MGDLIRAAVDDPTAVVVEVLLVASAGREDAERLQREARALSAHYSWSTGGAETARGWRTTLGLGESKSGPDLEALRGWLDGHALVRQVVIEIGPNWRPAA